MPSELASPILGLTSSSRADKRFVEMGSPLDRLDRRRLRQVVRDFHRNFKLNQRQKGGVLDNNSGSVLALVRDEDIRGMRSSLN